MLAHPRILKLARLALDIGQDGLAASAGVSRRILRKLEACDENATVRTLRAVQSVLEGKGITFLRESEDLGSEFRAHFGCFRHNWNYRDEGTDTNPNMRFNPGGAAGIERRRA